MLPWLLTAVALAAETVLAVLPLEANTADARLQPLGYGLSDMLVTDMHGVEGLRLVERARLDRVMAEFALQEGGFTDPRTAAEVGRGVGATHVLVGSLTDALEGVRLDVRLVNVSTAEVTTTAKAAGAPETVLQLEADVANQLIEALGGKPTVTAESIGFDELLTASARLASSESDRLKQLRAVKRYQDGAWRRGSLTYAIDGTDSTIWTVTKGNGDAVTAPTIANRLGHQQVLDDMDAARAIADKRVKQSYVVGGVALGAVVAMSTANRIARARHDRLDELDPSLGAFEPVPGRTPVVTLGSTIMVMVPLGALVYRQQVDLSCSYPHNWYAHDELDPELERYNVELARELGLTEEQRLRVDLQHDR